jgi:hypothetical protein
MRDQNILRDLAKKYLEVTSEAEQDERRQLWRQHNSLKPTPPPI